MRFCVGLVNFSAVGANVSEQSDEFDGTDPIGRG